MPTGSPSWVAPPPNYLESRSSPKKCRFRAIFSPRPLFADVADRPVAVREPWQHLAGKHLGALDCLPMGEKTGAAYDVEIPEGARLALELHDLTVDGVGIPGEENALRDSLLRCDRDECRRVLRGGFCRPLFCPRRGWPVARVTDCWPWFAAIDLG